MKTHLRSSRFALGSCALAAAGMGLSLFLYSMRDRIALAQRISVSIEDQTVRLAAKPPATGAVATVMIDERSLKQFGQWPWSRIILSELTHKLFEAGAEVVAFDEVFAEPDRLSPRQLRPFWASLCDADLKELDKVPDSDEVFAEALAAHPAAILGGFVTLTEQDTPRPVDDPLYRRHWMNATGGNAGAMPSDVIASSEAVLPLAVLRKASGALGILTTTPDFDRVIRRTPLLFRLGPDKLYSALSVEAVRLYSKRTNLFYQLDPSTSAIRAVNLRELPIRVDEGARAVLNYRSSFPAEISASDVMADALPQDALKGKIVFVGASAAGLFDLVNTPVGRNIPGVMIHAIAADDILSGDLLATPRFWPWVIALAGALGLAAAFLPSVSAGVSATVALQAALFLIPVLLRRYGLYAASPFEPMLCELLCFLGVALARFKITEAQRKRVRGMFSSMVSPDVLRHLEEQPEGIALQGERKKVVALFTDVESFTAISEKLAPPRLADLLREYFTPMTDICLSHGAYINKFIGDAIMAVYNVPTDIPNPEAEALRSAVEMQRKLAELRPDFEKRYGVTVRMRIGIHAGEAIVGNMGSAKRFEYTVLGDTVNLASRLEGENKKHGTWILASKEVIEAAGPLPGIVPRLVGEVTVRNRTVPATVYTVEL
jgi:adenylate cyclase